MGNYKYRPLYEGQNYLLYCDDSDESRRLARELKERGITLRIHERPGDPILDAVDYTGKQISPHFIGKNEIESLYLT